MKSAPSGIFVLLSLLFDLAASKLFLSLPAAHKYEGETNFFVLCRDPDEGEKVVWRNPKNRLINNKPENNVVKQDTTHGSQLIFKTIRKEDEGTYYCKNKKDQIEFQLFVAEVNSQDSDPKIDATETPHKTPVKNRPHDIHTTVSTIYATLTTFTTTEDPIAIVNTPTLVKGKEGKDVVMNCEARNGDPQILVDGNKPTNNTKYKVLGDGLLIVNATAEDSQHQYICQAMNLETGTFKTVEISLIINHPPRPTNVYEKHNIVYGYLGGTVNLTCEVEAEPQPNFKWFRKDKHKNIGQKVHLTNPRVSVISVFLESPKDFGEYKCEASNSEGTLVTSFTLEMGTRPEPPEFVEIVEANSTSMSIYIEPPNVTKEEAEPKLDPTGFLVEYRPVDEPFWSAQSFPQIAEDKTYILSNLTKNTTYQVRVATLNLAGSSAFTNETEYTTTSSAVMLNVPILSVLVLFSVNKLLFKTLI